MSWLRSWATASGECEMSRMIEAVYDGKVFRPSEPVMLKPNTRVKIMLDTEEEEQDKPKSFLQTARALNLEGPVDWARNIDEYLYNEKGVNTLLHGEAE